MKYSIFTDFKRFVDSIKKIMSDEVEDEAKKSGHYTKHGVKYSSLPNRSSAPHESFAYQSGKLSKSIDTKMEGKTAYVGSDLDYMKFLELGTKYMKERPTLGIAVKDTEKEVFEKLDKRFDKLF